MTASTVLTGRCPGTPAAAERVHPPYRGTPAAAERVHPPYPGTPAGADRVHPPYLGTQSRSRTTTS